MKRLLCLGLAVALAALLALPAMAKKDRLPAPDVRWVWAGEFFSGGSRYYCIELGFEPVEGASLKAGSTFRSHNTLKVYHIPEAYKLRVWVKGAAAPKLNPADWMVNLAPNNEQWNRYLSGQSGPSGASSKWVYVGYCGYDENQTLRVRVRAALETDSGGGKVSKTFRLKLPSFGTFGSVNIRAEMAGGHVFYGKVRP